MKKREKGDNIFAIWDFKKPIVVLFAFFSSIVSLDTPYVNTINFSSIRDYSSLFFNITLAILYHAWCR
jgi:hypothetical protein